MDSIACTIRDFPLTLWVFDGCTLDCRLDKITLPTGTADGLHIALSLSAIEQIRSLKI
jgi:hypothetical protein